MVYEISLKLATGAFLSRMRMAKWKVEEEPGEVKSIRIKSSLKSERKKTLAAARLTF